MCRSPPPPPPPLISFFRTCGLSQLAAAVTRAFCPPPQANTLAPPLLVCAVYDVSHLLPQPHPTTFNPPYPTTCTVTSLRTSSNTITITIPHHTTPGKYMLTTLPQSWHNVSLRIAPALTTALNWGGGGGLRHIFSDQNIICCGKIITIMG